jgi:predicted AlkP superfamily phosphohydrolase/phosphomutase
MIQSKHVLIIGVDGGTFSLIRPWAEQGYLPNLKRLLDGGVSRDLLSTFPPVTSPAWPSFMTGMNPGQHGVFDFIRPKGGNYDMVNSTSIRQPTLWDWLSSAGRRVGVVNVPVTYPPHPVNGFMITGLLSPRNATISYPDDLIKRYEPELGPYRIAPDVQCKRGEEELFIADLMNLEEVRGRYTLALLENEPWDVMAVVFGATDVGSHALWRFADETHPAHDPNTPENVKNGLRDIYAVVDAQIGRLVEATPSDTTIIVMSDHGFGPLHYTINLNLLLMEKGLMHLRRAPFTQLKAFLFRRGISPKRIYAWLEKVGLHHLASRVSKEQRNKVVGKFLSYDDVDWERTRAFSIGHVGQIYINTRGMQPYGSVEPGEETDTVRQEVIDALNGLRHPVTGEPIVDRIILREEEFSGPYAMQGPDIQVVLDGYRCISFPLFATSPELFTEQIRGDSGCHRLEGIFIASGPGIRRGSTSGPAHITDVAPTVMYLLGLPIPAEMSGQPLQDILEEPHEAIYASPNPRFPDAETGLMPSEENEIEERLRSLGYLE